MTGQQKRGINVGVVGYGPAFNMGKYHLDAMQAQGFTPRAVCDVQEERLQAARREFPGIGTYADLGDMLKKSDVELVAVILPHNLHAPAAVRCLNAGRHVVVEKPFALTVRECDRMIAAAKKNKVMLSVYQNRHWDANILTIGKHLPRIGRPFRWESFTGGYAKPRPWWRSDKKISGGIIYDWGAHFVEWMFQVMDYEMVEISGYGLNEVWSETTNEDEVEAVVRFRGDAVASHTESSVAAADKPMIRICGTRGAIVATHTSVAVHTVSRKSGSVANTVPMVPRTYERFYANIRDHLLKRKPLIITPEWARRVVQVLEYACRSADAGRPVRPQYP